MKLKLAVIMMAMNSALSLGQQGTSCQPTPTPTPGPTPGPNNAPDPAFFGVDRKPKTARVDAAKPLFVTSPAGKIGTIPLKEVEQAAWASWEKAFRENPRQGYKMAIEVWGENHSRAFQQQALLLVRAAAETTDERANLDFMLACLVDAGMQREECLQLGKGNGLERQLGARRLALLESNPQLAGK